MCCTVMPRQASTSDVFVREVILLYVQPYACIYFAFLMVRALDRDWALAYTALTAHGKLLSALLFAFIPALFQKTHLPVFPASPSHPVSKPWISIPRGLLCQAWF